MADFLSTAVDDSGSPSAENGLSHEHNAERSGLPMGPSSSSSRGTPPASDAINFVAAEEAMMVDEPTTSATNIESNHVMISGLRIEDGNDGEVGAQSSAGAHGPAGITASLEDTGKSADLVLLKRGHFFFFGSPDGMMASDDGGVASIATVALIVAIDKVRNELWKTHIDDFKRLFAADSRQISKQEVLAYLLADALGLPVLWHGDALKVGQRGDNALAKYAKEMPPAKKKAAAAVRMAKQDAAGIEEAEEIGKQMMAQVSEQQYNLSIPGQTEGPRRTRYVNAEVTVTELEEVHAMLEDASRRAENRAMITGARADAASLAFMKCDKPDWDEYAAARPTLPPEAARRWERSLEAHAEEVQKLADAMVATGQVDAAAAQEHADAGRLASSAEAELYAAQEKEEVKAAAAREAAWSLAAARAAMLREVSAAPEPEPEPEPEAEDEEAECERLDARDWPDPGLRALIVCSTFENEETLSLVRAIVELRNQLEAAQGVDELQVLGEFRGIGSDGYRDMSFSRWREWLADRFT